VPAQFAALSLLVAACGGGTTRATPDAGADAAVEDVLAPGDAPGRAVIEIYVAGDLTPKTFTDGASGETPTLYTMGLSRFDLLRSPGDPAPVTVFDHGSDWAEVDLLTTTLVGTADTASLPAGPYSHARVRLTMAKCTVAATAHQSGFAVPGTLTTVAAFTGTSIGGQTYTKGEARFTFTASLGGFSQSVTGAIPALPPAPGVTIVEDATGTWLVFPFPEPLALDPTDPATHRATITFDVYESFRWQDQNDPGYAAGVFDLTATGAEPVTNFGVTGYRLAAQ
jgi:hypothetical protein